MAEYTETEKLILDHLAIAADLFPRLERQHPMEVAEFLDAIHRAQAIVMARFAQRHEDSGLTPVKGD